MTTSNNHSLRCEIAKGTIPDASHYVYRLIRTIFRIQNILLVVVQVRLFARKELAIDVLLGRQ